MSLRVVPGGSTLGQVEVRCCLGLASNLHLSQASLTLAEQEEETRGGVETTGLVKHQP